MLLLEAEWRMCASVIQTNMVQTMVCRRFGWKALSEPMFVFGQMVVSKFHENCNREMIFFTQINVIENGICEIVVILSRPQCVLQNGGIFVSVSMCYCFLKNCFDVKGFNFVVHRKYFPCEQAGSIHVMIKDLRIPSCRIPTMSCLDSWNDACDSVHSRSRESSISFQHGESLHLKSSFYQLFDISNRFHTIYCIWYFLNRE